MMGEMLGQTLLGQNRSPAPTWQAVSSASGCLECPPTDEKCPKKNIDVKEPQPER